MHCLLGLCSAVLWGAWLWCTAVDPTPLTQWVLVCGYRALSPVLHILGSWMLALELELDIELNGLCTWTLNPVHPIAQPKAVQCLSPGAWWWWSTMIVGPWCWTPGAWLLLHSLRSWIHEPRAVGPCGAWSWAVFSQQFLDLLGYSMLWIEIEVKYYFLAIYEPKAH